MFYFCAFALTSFVSVFNTARYQIDVIGGFNQSLPKTSTIFVRNSFNAK